MKPMVVWEAVQEDQEESWSWREACRDSRSLGRQHHD